MASPAFTERGGTDAEYEIYKALYSTGRVEDRDFQFKPPATTNLDFLVFSPTVGIRVGESDTRDVLISQSLSPMVPRVETISEQAALTDGRIALRNALGG